LTCCYFYNDTNKQEENEKEKMKMRKVENKKTEREKISRICKLSPLLIIEKKPSISKKGFRFCNAKREEEWFKGNVICCGV
jgi:hypothetical protein